ncbi:MAG: hypothetical protein LBB68_00730 [Treponema sp.]|nr:hypothetical protein [Treponema sp.]
MKSGRLFYRNCDKSTEHVNWQDIRHLKGLQNFLPKPLKQSFVLSQDREVHYYDDTITALHAAYFLC